MATTSSIRSRRRPVRAVTQLNRAVLRSSLSTKLLRLALSPTAKTAYLVIGTAGLAGLAVALIGPKKLDQQLVKPLRGAVEPQAEKLWTESRPLREQIAGLFRSASPTGRERLVKNFQSWIGHFHAT